MNSRQEQALAVRAAIVEFLQHDAPWVIRFLMDDKVQWLLLDRILKALWR